MEAIANVADKCSHSKEPHVLRGRIAVQNAAVMAAGAAQDVWPKKEPE